MSNVFYSVVWKTEAPAMVDPLFEPDFIPKADFLCIARSGEPMITNHLPEAEAWLAEMVTLYPDEDYRILSREVEVEPTLPIGEQLL